MDIFIQQVVSGLATLGFDDKTKRMMLLALNPGVTVENVLENTGGFQVSYRPDYLIDGEKLRAAGIARGDPVAMVGDAFEAYAAFAISSPIIAQVMDSTGFWALTPAARTDLQGRLSGAGVRAILANNIAAYMTAEGWRILARSDSSNLGVLLLRRLE